MDSSLIPTASDLYEHAIETSLAERWDALGAGVDAIARAKHITRPPSFLPYLVYEYGLGELTPYVPNLYNLLDEGIAWQRVRGTPNAVARGLGWIGYAAAIEDAWHGRNYWNSYQLRFTTLPGSDDPDLERIEGIATLSVPKRSQLRRGVFQYDAGALIGDGSRLDDSLLERESGIAITEAGTLWSFGRTTEIEHTLTEAEGVAIGNWIEIPAEGGLPWVEMTYPWVTATFPWAATAATARKALMSAWFETHPLYLTLRDSDGLVIGHRRCRASRPVILQFAGAYTVAGSSYQPIAGGTIAYIEAMTDFGDAADVVAAAIQLTVGASPADGIPPGRLWLEKNDLIGGSAIAVTPVSIPLRATVRDQFKILMRF